MGRPADLFTLIREADRLETAFDFDQDNFGHDLTEIAAECTLVNMDAECDPEGNRWAELSDRYKAWKDVVAPGEPIGVLFKVMKTIEQLRGYVVVRPHAVTHTYGVDELAVQHAIKFQEGGLVTGTSQPQRYFWGFTALAADRMGARSDLQLDNALA